jgi:hypothetical protein
MSTVVKNMNILKAMQKAELITFCKDTGNKVGVPFSSGKRTAYYVNDYGPKANNLSFEFKGNFYRVQYFDGCFHPFVVQYIPPHRNFVSGE